MNKVIGVKISKEVERLVKERVTPGYQPYTFLIRGVTGHGYDLFTTAHIAFEKIKKWAEREGAEVALLHDEYQAIADGNMEKTEGKPLEYQLYKRRAALTRYQSKGFLKIEVTDPAARIMEQIIRSGK